jgi:LacI family repressor for deo operon, udp, cdd, tsx, nupC, and nupG
VRATVKDVARRAGVSPKTVSNVMNGVVPVSGSTRLKVEQAILELDYVPNLSARGLRNGRSGVIALALPDLATPYSAEIAQNVVEVAHEQGWSCTDRGDRLRSPARIRTDVPCTVQPHRRPDPQPRGARRERRQSGRSLPPVVLLGEVSQQLADRVWVDSVAAARDMTLALPDGPAPHRRARNRRGPALGSGRSARTRGYEQAALDELGIDPDDSLLIPCEKWTPQTAADALAAYLDSNPLPDALFCFTDSMAIGALSVLWKRGIKVPEDIAVAGFDDIADGQYAVPSLTTVSFDKRLVAREALRLLTERMADRAGKQRVVTVGYSIVQRNSTAS